MYEFLIAYLHDVCRVQWTVFSSSVKSTVLSVTDVFSIICKAASTTQNNQSFHPYLIDYWALTFLFLFSFFFAGWDHFLVSSLCFLFILLLPVFRERLELWFDCGFLPPLYERHLVRWAALTPTDWRWKRAELWFRSGQQSLLLYMRSRTKWHSLFHFQMCRRWALVSKSQRCV